MPTSETCLDEILSPELIATQKWLKLKAILTKALLQSTRLTDSERTELCHFLAEEWLSVPRQTEVAALQQLLAAKSREIEQLKTYIRYLEEGKA